MTCRTIEVSGEGARLSLKHHQVVVSKGGREVGRIPAEEVALLIVDTPTASYTHPVVVEILDRGGAIVLCGADHQPVGMALPTVGHHLQSERFRAQVESSLPTRKRLWAGIVREKILRQRANAEDDETGARLARLAGEVKSGDPTNREAAAAQAYWRTYLPEFPAFRRRRDGDFPNALLNYGYAAFRASIARALTGAGLHPSLGLHHANRYNAFCLADDLLEPFRPAVDMRVRTLYRDGWREVDRDAKARVLELLTSPWETESGVGPFHLAAERLAYALAECFAGARRDLSIPGLHRTAVDGPPK